VKRDISVIYNHNLKKATIICSALILLSNNAGAPVAIVQNQPIGVFYGTFFAGNPDGSQLKNAAGIPLIELGVQNSALSYTPGRTNGLPSGSTLRKVVGDPNPKYSGSVVNEVSYKKLALRAQVDYLMGADIW